MAIARRTADDCFDAFLGHVRQLVGDVLTRRYPMLCPRPPKGRRQNVRTLSFANAVHDHAVPLDTRDHGTVYLYLAQELTAKQEGGQDFVLRTQRYWYKLYGKSPSLDDDAIVRWEYVRPTSRVHATPCRHHVQFGKMVEPHPLGESKFNFTRFHIPSGWVTIEEVCRFLICEFGIAPPCGDDWPRILADAESRFYSSFTNRGGSGYPPNP